jgi:hypothetical protein
MSNQNRRLLCLVTVLALTAPTGARAQDEAPRKAPPYPGVWGAQLQLSDVFRGESSTGTRILVKRMGSRYAGFRLGAGIDVSWADDDTVDSTETRRIESNEYTFDLSAEMLFYPIRDRRVQPYFGFGVVFAYSDLSSERTPDGTALSGSATGYGGIATLGGEWFAVERMSLYAEYGLQIISWNRSAEYDSAGGSTSKRDLTEGGFSTRSVVFGLGFYF